ncbi:MAG: hypothetical protein JOY77_10235, partial [Alphaproteobacteria bacterium]|nr:hypothetical protein [Alphaproteobacteria bacterium]
MRWERSLRALAIAKGSMLLASQPVAASSETILYNFPADVNPGFGLLPGKANTFYGPTTDGGSENLGSIYQLKQTKDGWKKKDIYSFGSNDAHYPSAGLTQGATSGVLYGVTSSGPNGDYGAIFSLTKEKNIWRETVLHEFDGSDGELPGAVLLRSSKIGYLYGSTEMGGDSNCGTLFQIDGSGTFSRIFSFDSSDQGCNPSVPLQQDSSAKNLIGATSHGGASNVGTIYRLADSGGTWSETVLHSLDGGSEGAYPSDLTPKDKSGLYYGVAQMNGFYNSGVVFQVGENIPYKVIYSFKGGSDGVHPLGLYLDASTGVLYGTTLLGGSQNKGTVFKLVFDGTQWNETILHSFTG